MDFLVVCALGATCLTWLVTALGAATVFLFRHPSPKIMNLMLGFSAGVMIAASFWSLLQPAIERATEASRFPPYFIVTLGFLCGALFMWCSDKIVTHAHKRAAREEERGARFHRIVMLVLSITLHNIPEGLAVGVAFGVMHRTGVTQEAFMGAVSIALGIALQNFPEGAAVSVPLRREGYSRRRCFLLGQASGMVEPVAGVVGAIAVIYVEAMLPVALSFAAGTMILVAVHELIPECQQSQPLHPYFATMGIIGGFATMMLLDVALG